MPLLQKNGFTLLELIIGILLGSIVTVALFKLHNAILSTYNHTLQHKDMQLNTQYVLKTLSEEIRQAGANLPDSAYPILFQNSGKYNEFSLRTNLNAATFSLAANLTNKKNIPCPDASLFSDADTLLIDKINGTLSLAFIDKTYNSSGFSSGIKTTSVPNQIYLKSAVTLDAGDVFYGMKHHRFFLNNRILYLTSTENPIAEDIDSLVIIFFDVHHSVTQSWDAMKSCFLFVQGKTSLPDRKYTHPVYKDGYRRFSLTAEFKLKNR